METGFKLDINAFNRPYWDALSAGDLIFQSCDACDHKWLPPSRACPKCLSTTWRWKNASGQGSVLSWVVYHVAYHPAFKDRLPYNVAIIELQEGPRLISNVVGDFTQLAAGVPVSLVIEKEGDIDVPRFLIAT